MKGKPGQKDYPRNLGPLRLVENEFKEDLAKDLINYPNGKYIFVGSSTDMWSIPVLPQWIGNVLRYCKKFPENAYLFQSKNPGRFTSYLSNFPINTILGTTIESNRPYPEYSNSPHPIQRAKAIKSHKLSEQMKTMITIEPILDFDYHPFLEMIKDANPDFITIGADSKVHGLKEPSKEKVEQFINELKAAGLNVLEKKNLNRLLK